MEGGIADIAALELKAIVDELGHRCEIIGRLGGDHQHQRIFSRTQSAIHSVEKRAAVGAAKLVIDHKRRGDGTRASGEMYENRQP